MMSVLSDGVDLDTGKYYCDQLVLAHETGHNLGLMHDRATVATQGGDWVSRRMPSGTPYRKSGARS